MQVYINGKYLDKQNARISVFDRGFLFGDGIYEVIPVYQHCAFYFKEHIQRLISNLNRASIPLPLKAQGENDLKQKLQEIFTKLIQHNALSKEPHYVYLHVSRGVEDKRDHTPQENTNPTIFAYIEPIKIVDPKLLEYGLKIISKQDNRWQLCDLKSTSLMSNVLLKLTAKKEKVDDVILFDNKNNITEASAANFLVITSHAIISPVQNNAILPGITKLVIKNIAKANNINYFEQDIKKEDLLNKTFSSTQQLVLCSSTKEILPIKEVDGRDIGMPNWLFTRLLHLYQEHKQNYITNNLKLI